MFGLGQLGRLGLSSGGKSPVLTPPADFGWTPPITISLAGGVYSTDYDPTPFLIEGAAGVTTFYIDAQAGNDANPGTAVSPKKSFYPITGGRYNKLLLKIRGTFYRNSASYIQYAHDNLCVEAWGGADAVLTSETDPVLYPHVWISEGGGTWSTTSPGAEVYAGTDVETLTRLTNAASSAVCLATPSTQFTDWGGNKQWVHTATGASPATGHTVFLEPTPGIFECSANAYPQRAMFNGINFRGGDTAFLVYGDSAYSKQVEFISCTFKHAKTHGAFHATGNSTVIHYGCTAGPSRFDGFAYSTASGGVGGNVPNSIEIDCVGRNCGTTSGGANQGSTTHFGGKSVRVNCSYYNNTHDQVADVGAGTRSWNLGVVVGPKRAGTTTFAGFNAGNDGTDIRMWLDGCTFSAVSYDVNAVGGGKIYYRNMPAPGVGPTTTGTVETY